MSKSSAAFEIECAECFEFVLGASARADIGKSEVHGEENNLNRSLPVGFWIFQNQNTLSVFWIFVDRYMFLIDVGEKMLEINKNKPFIFTTLQIFTSVGEFGPLHADTYSQVRLHFPGTVRPRKRSRDEGIPHFSCLYFIRRFNRR